MAMMPKRTKFRKAFRGKVEGYANRGNTVAYGEFGLQALEPGWITARQIEAGRVAATHFLAGQGQVFIRIFPHKPVSAKPIEVRMGSGKGDISHYVAIVHPGTVLFEIGGVPLDVARQALKRTVGKMPIRGRFVGRRIEL
jgi:large subunit ribosomal protein L16